MLNPDVEVEIDINKRYLIPENIVEKSVDGKILVISVESGNWLVLKNNFQKQIFDQLKIKSIEETINYLEENNMSEEELIEVLTELEAKQFENISVKYPEKSGICIYLTNKCNLRCQHCYMYAGEKSSDELKTDEIFDLLTEYRKFGGKVVTFTGGEVTERTDLREILRLANNLGYKITVLTNGVNWDDHLVEDVYRLIDEIQISIDGFDEKSNAKVRGKGFFDKSLFTIDKFIERNVKVTVAITPLFNNLTEDLDAYINFGKKLIEKYKEKAFRLKFNCELLNGRNIEVDEEQNKEYSKIIEKIAESCYPGSKQKEFILNHRDNTIYDNCGYGGITISATGDVYFCNRIFDVNKYGNIRDISFKRILELSQKAMSLSNINNLKPCCECELKYICGGGCRIKYFNELVKLKSLDNTHAVETLKARNCNSELKYKYYQMMIETNVEFYR